MLLAFNAGAINAGGFLVLRMYTSHMTGFTSQLADGLVLGNTALLLSALGAVLAFMIGAGACALLVSWGRLHQLNSVYALPLLLEALLMFPFGLMGAVTLTWGTLFTVPLTVLLLSFIMGLQNAVGSKAFGAGVRTTHMTGNVTDLGMELGKLIFVRRHPAVTRPSIQPNWQRLQISAGLLGMFVFGGIVGAFGFKHVGFICVIPLAALLLALSVPPLLQDLPRFKALFAFLGK